MDASERLSCENNNSSLFSAVPDSSNMYQNKDSNLISDIYIYSSSGATTETVYVYYCENTHLLSCRSEMHVCLPSITNWILQRC